MRTSDTSIAGAPWRKSSYSGGGGEGGGNCVEYAPLHDGRVAVRDSKDPDGAVLTFSATAFRSWTRQHRGGAPSA